MCVCVIVRVFPNAVVLTLCPIHHSPSVSFISGGRRRLAPLRRVADLLLLFLFFCAVSDTWAAPGSGSGGEHSRHSLCAKVLISPAGGRGGFGGPSSSKCASVARCAMAGLPPTFPIAGDMCHMDTFAKFLSKQIVDRNLLNCGDASFFRDCVKKSEIVFKAPHGCWDLVYRRVDEDGKATDEEDSCFEFAMH